MAFVGGVPGTFQAPGMMANNPGMMANNPGMMAGNPGMMASNSASLMNGPRMMANSGGMVMNPGGMVGQGQAPLFSFGVFSDLQYSSQPNHTRQWGWRVRNR